MSTENSTSSLEKIFIHSPTASTSFQMQSSSSQDSYLKLLPPMAEISKRTFPIFDGEADSFDVWRTKFTTMVGTSELAPLFDLKEKNIYNYGVFIQDENFEKYELQLYSRIIEALPSSSTFIINPVHFPKGISLWHALVEAYDLASTAVSASILQQSFYSLTRPEGETVDMYWNRFQTQLHKLQCAKGGKPEDQDLVRIQFLTSLKGEFEFLATDIRRESLDPKWRTLPDAKLITELRKIQQNEMTAPTATVSSLGYANALKPNIGKQNHSQNQVDDSIAAALISQGERLEAIATCVMACAESLSKLSNRNQQKDRKRYCWSCGEQYGHSSKYCPNKKSGHQDGAHWKNRMEGSSATVPDKE